MAVLDELRALAYQLPIGQHKKRCPSCSATRSKNQREPCLSLKVSGDCMVYRCWHCGMDGIIPFNEREKVQMHYQAPKRIPEIKKNSELTEACTNWLSSRGISAETSKACGVFSTRHWINAESAEVECVGFAYDSDDLGVSAKIRSLGTKGFSCTRPLKTFFNLTSVKDGDTLIICEGEMDALSFYEAGFKSAVSVPNGAVNKLSTGQIDPHDDKTFSFLWDNKEVLDGADRIVIATDSDDAGQMMAEELSRRIGKDRCWKIVWPEDCKDGNEVLVKHGVQGLTKLVVMAEPWPISGVYDASHYLKEVMDLYHNGLESGLSTGYPSLDELYTVVQGQLTIVTGIPSHGKSEFIDQLMMNQAMQFSIKFAVCSFENHPSMHITNLVSKFCGKPFSKKVPNRVSESELKNAYEFIYDHFTFLSYNDGKLVSLDDVLERLKVAVLRRGVRGAVIDPYNYIRRDGNLSETDWISEMLTKVRSFAQAYGVHIWFVAHPTKQQKENGNIPPPKGYDISGSAAWFAKADCGLTVHRPDFTTTETEIHLWKVRFSWVGRQGVCSLFFDRSTMRYNEDPPFSARYNQGNQAPF